MITTLENQCKTISDLNLSIIGRLFWVSIPSREAWTRTEFESYMAIAGVPIEVSPALSNRSDFIRALRGMEEGRLVRLVREDKEEIVFQATKELQDNIGLEYKREAVITLDKSSGDIVATDIDFANLVRSKVGNEKDLYHGEDLRRLVRRMLSTHAKSIKPRSGVYFIPEDNFHWVEILKNFLNLLGVQDIGEFPLADLESIKKQMGKVYTEEAKKAIVELEGEVKQLQDTNANSTVVSRRLKKINTLREKCKLYQDALSIQGEEIETKLASIEDTIKEILLGE